MARAAPWGPASLMSTPSARADRARRAAEIKARGLEVLSGNRFALAITERGGIDVAIAHQGTPRG